MAEEHIEGWKPGDPIGYIRQEIPEFEVPAYEGERYEALVPDTFDLQERAALGVNVLTSATDPQADYEIYFGVRFNANPPFMRHEYSDICQMKFMEALPLLRIVSGSDLNAHVGRRWMEVALHQQGPDGLAYLPRKGRPWALIRSDEHTQMRTKADTDQDIVPAYGGRLLSAMMLYHRRDRGAVWKQAAEQLVDGLVELAVDRGQYVYYAPSPLFAVKGNMDDHGRVHPGLGAHVAFITLGLVHVCRETGYEPALRLAEKLIHYTLEEIDFFDEDASFRPGVPLIHPGRSHFHMHTYALLSMLEYARVTGDASLLEFVRKGYEYGKAHGDVLVGYFPENIDAEQFWTSELCEVADMIALGLKLTEAGMGDYWDDVDRWVRNMFAEGQLTPARADWLKRQARPASHRAPLSVTDLMYQYQTTERVVERNVGAFANPNPNDWGHWISHCCTGNGTRAIYYIWEHMLTHGDNKLRVNLLLNRASPWADIDSHIPYVGQVDVRIKRPVDLSLRIPEWTTPEEVRVQVSGEDRRVGWEGRYAQVGEVKPGDVVTMTFPIAERTDTVWIEKDRYALVRKGNDVVAIDPPGQYCPLYQREHYRENGTRWRKVERFVSRERIHW